MFHHNRRPCAGFTLIELAIVMGVAGIMVAGFWRLVGSGNAQMRDQAAANQQMQLIGAVNGYLQSDNGQTFLGAVAANGTVQVSLPTQNTSNANCRANIATNPDLCDFLPSGFTNATTNSYGQTFVIRALKDTTPQNTKPQTYSFMIVTQGGDQISDASGGRISGLIGGDGGFLYSVNVCAAANATTACGSYGSWQATTTSYGFGATNFGRIATRTYYAPMTSSSDYWLARRAYPGDATNAYNTMSSNLYVGATNSLFMVDNNPANVAVAGGSINMRRTGTTGAAGSLNMWGGDINMVDTAAATAGAGTINVADGTIRINSGQFSSVRPTSAYTTPAIQLTAGGGTFNVANNATTLLRISPNCSVDTVTGLTQDNNCMAGLSVVGDAQVVGRLNVNSLYSQTFVYGSSIIGSDRRLKKDITPISGSLDKIMQIKPVAFEYISNGIKSMGVIAQELEKIYPHLVTTNPQGMLGVNYDGLIAPLIDSVQQLKKENDELRQQINDLKARQNKLEKLGASPSK